MNKREFVEQARKFVPCEPTRDQWIVMWDIHVRNELYSVNDIVDMAFGKRMIDMRRIPDEHKRDALSLEELAKFAAEQHLIFSKGMVDARKNNNRFVRNRLG
jgi:hypothetical protein